MGLWTTETTLTGEETQALDLPHRHTVTVETLTVVVTAQECGLRKAAECHRAVVAKQIT